MCRDLVKNVSDFCGCSEAHFLACEPRAGIGQRLCLIKVKKASAVFILTYYFYLHWTCLLLRATGFGSEITGEGAMILGKLPYRGYHLVLLRHSEAFQIRILDGRNNDVQLGLSTAHATEEDALEEAKRKVDSIVEQCRF